MSTPRIAVQMYTLRKEMKQDFQGTLKEIAKLGFDGVELAGYGGLTAIGLRDTLHDLGLKVAANHVPLADLENKLDEVIEYQKILGNSHIVCPILPEDRQFEEDYEELIKTLNDVGEKCAQAGITLSYHNHDFELVPLKDGRKPLSRILDETNPEWVKAEFDVYWLTKAGEDPVEWLKAYEGRTPLIHLKDMTTDGEQFFAELGAGGVDLQRIFAQLEKSQVEWWIIEQDQCRQSPFKSVAKSLQYLKNKKVNI
ncbi:sugar phosphate isomerase/epimerase [Bacillus sp. FJAT-50079]|uniref:sugar phosphate isomerase/epimerase family protein n=1 Tax=Bacillus sp. FJAT-50079 TaxID=2833577 RepID=UPI001BC8F3DD|nr:sugar phosphate isomerase/epimerase [Bacillus sp. FJAT-50079]MBS4208103.1 sugar phosphate isomerase/epimerase [Bacillus sp. FJAT-50079]